MEHRYEYQTERHTPKQGGETMEHIDMSTRQRGTQRNK
jgi:hypothetical protein